MIPARAGGWDRRGSEAHLRVGALGLGNERSAVTPQGQKFNSRGCALPLQWGFFLNLCENAMFLNNYNVS